MKTLWRKNQENSSDRISHAWAPLKGAKATITIFNNAPLKKFDTF
jgi:hypothetical protein